MIAWAKLVLFFVSNLVLLTLAGVASAQTDAPAATDSTTSEKTVTEKVTTIRETDTQIVQQQVQGVITAAIFVKNRADGVPDSKVSVLEDLVTGHLTDKGFRIISREDMLNSVAAFAGAGANQGDPNLAGANLDKLLSNNSSAVRLAQNMGANYILIAAIDTYATDTNQYDEGDIHTLIAETKMSLSYKLLDANNGGSVSAGVVDASDKERVQPGQKITKDFVDELLSEASVKLSRVLSDKAAAGRVAAAAPLATGQAQFTVVVTMADLTVPITTRNGFGDFVVATNATVEIPATVEVDGVAAGTTPGPLQALPGIHKVRISAAGFRDWNYTSFIHDGQQLNVALQLNEEGYSRWGASAAFLQGLKDKATLTSAEADKIQGIAQMYRQSGFKVDIKKNIDIKSNMNRNIDISGAPAPQQVVVPVVPVVPVYPVAPVAGAAPQAAPATQP